jgi:hypothetical protein
MELEKGTQTGICYECSTKNADSSQKRVYHCDICKKWFCEKHQKPKFPYFVDWDTVFDVQGNPEIKARFHTEFKSEDGHPDFVYLRQKLEEIELEKKIQDIRIQQRITDMINSGPPKMSLEYETWLGNEQHEKSKRIEQLEKEQRERMKRQKKELEKKIDRTKWWRIDRRLKEAYEERMFEISIEKNERAFEREVERASHNKKDSRNQPEKKKHWWQ